MLEKWYKPQQLAEKYNVSKSTARRIMMILTGDDTKMTQRNKGSGKRSYKMRRLPESRLVEFETFLNG